MNIKTDESKIDKIKTKKIYLNDFELSNAATLVEWGINPIQVQICDSCGIVACSDGGYIDIYKQNDLFILTIPSIYEYDNFELSRRYPLEAIIQNGPIIIEQSQYRIIESCYSMNYTIGRYPEVKIKKFDFKFHHWSALRKTIY